MITNGAALRILSVISSIWAYLKVKEFHSDFLADMWIAKRADDTQINPTVLETFPPIQECEWQIKNERS